MSNKSSGTASFFVDGDVIDLVGDLTWSIVNEEKETLVGMDGNTGLKYTKVPAFVEGTFKDSDELDMDALANLENTTVQIQLRNGKTVIFPEANQVARPETSGEEGSFTLRFESKIGRENK